MSLPSTTRALQLLATIIFEEASIMKEIIDIIREDPKEFILDGLTILAVVGGIIALWIILG